jgi:hypothetical protein
VTGANRPEPSGELHQQLPADRYAVTAVAEVPQLTAEQEVGIDQALSSLRHGEGIDHQLVKERIAAQLMR